MVFVQNMSSEQFEEFTALKKEGPTMDKEKMLEFLSAAIDEGAKINVLSYGTKKSKLEAFKVAKNFSRITGDKVKVAIGDNYKWFKVDGEKFQLSSFYDKDVYLEEDVKLDGMPEVNESA